MQDRVKVAGAGDDHGRLHAALSAASDLLPTQAILENFVHHNPLHHFEATPFHEAVRQAGVLIGLQGYAPEAFFEEKLSQGAIDEAALREVLAPVAERLPPLPPRFGGNLDALMTLFAGAPGPGDRRAIYAALAKRLLPEHVAIASSRYDTPAAKVLSFTGFDPRPRVREALSELSAAFLDRGAAAVAAPGREHGFLAFFASLETCGLAAWRASARHVAREILRGHVSAEEVVTRSLAAHGIAPDDWETALRAALVDLPGWAGMFGRMEETPQEAPPGTLVRLLDYLAVHTILTDASLRAAATTFAKVDGDAQAHAWLRRLPSLERLRRKAERAALLTDVTRLCERTGAIDIAACTDEELRQASRFMAKLGELPRRVVWLEALERAYLRQVVSGIAVTAPLGAGDETPNPTLQMFLCIDDRGESMRRYLEAEASGLETFGVPGFFGLPVTYHPADGRDPMVLCPLGVVPSQVLKEQAHPDDHAVMSRWRDRRKVGARVTRALARASRGPVLSVLVATILLPLVVARLLLETAVPGWFNHLRRLFFDAVLEPARTQLVATHTIEEAAKALAATFQGVGLRRRFAPLAVVVGHGSQSLNNPFFAAYDCGACSGHHGSPNARLFCQLANDPKVRAVLASAHDVHIPDSTWFVAALHETASDTVTLLDSDTAPESHRAAIAHALAVLTRACANNAFERCRRFLLADVRDPASAVKHVRRRSEDPAEVRPELNHATNASVIVGRRLLTRGLFLDRRAFLCSYDPFDDDERGTNLERVLAPGLIVCSGINLEYYFSATDPQLMGAGTKAPLNIVGHIGVLQGAYGDLRPGLPTQMTEMHTPVRALFVVDAPLARLEAVLGRRRDLDNLVRYSWVNMVVRDPSSGEFAVFTDNAFQPLAPRSVSLPQPHPLAEWLLTSSGDLTVALLPTPERP